jgi:hypothetical protein
MATLCRIGEESAESGAAVKSSPSSSPSPVDVLFVLLLVQVQHHRHGGYPAALR